jgi:hypothetical protein
MQIIKYILVIIIIVNLQTYTQTLTGRISEPGLGFSFTIPQDWQATKGDQGYILISENLKGFLLIAPHQFNSLEEIEQNASQGVNSGTGNTLTLVGNLSLTKNNGVEGTFKGILNGQASISYVISLLSPYGGGISIFAFTNSADYSDEYKNIVEKISESVKYENRITSSVADDWKHALNNCRLTYLNSYNSGNGNGGMQTKIVIDLCEKGYFNYSDESNILMNQGNIDGYSEGNRMGAGEWKILDKGDHAILQLTFNNGDVKDYLLSFEDDKTYLNGERYFRTYKDSTIEGTQPDCFRN